MGNPTTNFDGFSLLAALPDAVLLIDQQMHLAYVNDPARSLFPSLSGFAPGARLSRFIRHPAILDLAEQVLVAGAAPVPATMRITLPGQVDRRLSVSASVLDDLGGDRHALLLIHDDTAMWRAEQMRADFIANVSHELRTPIASVIGYIETLQGPARNDPAAHEQFLGIMNDQAQRMSRLIDDLLSLSRIETDEHMHPSASVSVKAVVTKAVNVVTPLLEREGVTLVQQLDDEIAQLSIPGNEDELVQMLQNLLDNAVKYGADAGRINLTANVDHDAGTVALGVQDFGAGIPPEHVPRLTERFYRVSTKVSRARGGTGLGLAIVKHIVNRHKARLEITSEEGKGSHFCVYLPLHRGAGQPAGSHDAQIDIVTQLP